MNKSKQSSNNKIPRVQSKNSTSKMVSAPLAKAKIDKILAPRYSMPKSSDGRVCIKHREYIGDILGSINFQANQFSINPGLALTFPWLNTIAIAYESYRFKKLHFIFNSSKSTATNGSVLMAVDFDPSDTAPTTKAQALAYNNAIRGPVWETFTYVCSPQDLVKMNQKFLRFGSLITGQDVLLYDVGNLFVCPSGCADTSVLGELHVDYEVEMFTPQFDLTAYALSTAARVNSSGTISNTNWLGTSVTQSGGVSVSYSSGALSVNIPGQYIFVYTLVGTGLAQSGSPTFSSAPGNLLSLISQSISTTSITYVFLVQVDTVSTPITVSGLTTAATTFVSSSLRIGYYAYSLA